MLTATSQDLLYVVRNGGNEVSVYTYPQGKPAGSLANLPGAFGICSDAKGDVFVVASESQQIYEFAHGGTKAIETLDDTGNNPNGCAIDPSSGNLAVAGGATNDANVAIYQDAQGSPTVYTYTAPKFTFCTYDSQGNVFIGGGVLFELPRGGSSFVQISVEGLHEVAPPGIQWDGSYIDLQGTSDSRKGPTTVYQIQVSGSTGTIVNQITLTSRPNKNPFRGAQFWVGNGIITSPADTVSNVGIWHYPQGGKAYHMVKVKNEGDLLTAVAVSRAHPTK